MDTKNCSHCGKELPSSARFCPYCMEKLTEVKESFAPKARILRFPHLSPKLIIGIAVPLAFTLLTLPVAVMFRDYNKNAVALPDGVSKNETDGFFNNVFDDILGGDKDSDKEEPPAGEEPVGEVNTQEGEQSAGNSKDKNNDKETEKNKWPSWLPSIFDRDNDDKTEPPATTAPTESEYTEKTTRPTTTKTTTTTRTTTTRPTTTRPTTTTTVPGVPYVPKDFTKDEATERYNNVAKSLGLTEYSIKNFAYSKEYSPHKYPISAVLASNTFVKNGTVKYHCGTLPDDREKFGIYIFGPPFNSSDITVDMKVTLANIYSYGATESSAYKENDLYDFAKVAIKTFDYPAGILNAAKSATKKEFYDEPLTGNFRYYRKSAYGTYQGYIWVYTYSISYNKTTNAKNAECYDLCIREPSYIS